MYFYWNKEASPRSLAVCSGCLTKFTPLEQFPNQQEE